MDVSKNRATPKWMVKIMENPIKMDDLGVPLFSETSICSEKELSQRFGPRKFSRFRSANELHGMNCQDNVPDQTRSISRCKPLKPQR